MHILALLLAVVTSLVAFASGSSFSLFGGTLALLIKGGLTDILLRGLPTVFAALLGLVGGVLAAFRRRSARAVLLAATLLAFLPAVGSLAIGRFFGLAVHISTICGLIYFVMTCLAHRAFMKKRRDEEAQSRQSNGSHTTQQDIPPSCTGNP